MSQGLKSNNKVKINLFLAGGIIFILIGAGLLDLVQKASATTHIYDFSLEAGVSRWAYEKSGAQPTNPANYDSEAEAGDYTNISFSNDTRWETSLAAAGEWDSQIYTFTISEDISNIISLTLDWEGYGEITSGFLTYFYVWNLSTGNWEQLDSRDFTSGTDITLTGGITSNISYYIDPGTKKLTIMTTTKKAGLEGEVCTSDDECVSGYCVDGVCCDGLCGGDCEACNLAGSEGICTTRGIDDNTEVTTQCYYCNGVNTSSQPYDGDNGVNCTDDCTRCSSGTCSDRPAGATDECSTCQACNAAGGDCVGITADDGKNCTDDCTYCNAGACSPVEDGTDPENDCGSGCQRCVSGSCQDYSGACSATDCYTGNCVSDACTIYSGGETGNCPTCQYCNDSDAACDNRPNNTQAGGCNALCQACQSGSCSFATAGTDPGSHCTNPVSGSKTTGCATGNCNSSHVCGAYTSGDRSCPVCWTCTDSDIACEQHNISYHDTCPDCLACDASGDCSDVLTENTDTDTGWGFNLYGCVGVDKRCYNGVCRTCGGDILFDDGCANCAGQGGTACWYESALSGTCSAACSGHGGCVNAQWNSAPGCTLHDALYGNCSFCASDPSTNAPWTNWSLLFRYCYYRSAGTNQSCGDWWLGIWRQCVCQY